MTQPSQILSKVQSQRKKLTSTAKATKYYSAQVNAIKSIKATDGYQEIRDYWLREYDDNVLKLTSTDATNVWITAKIQGEIISARRFLDWLDGMENPQG